ncbi:hypothetical protein MIN45_P2322 [Methylomarinovum tepidoasis]|uniref:PilZ domain-containing protein n=1 Tax=Methylomarinovum tepidoasis TaxID=2840183 RepID=A0AAU9CI18_9GAMM|nr:PilZ domain-containing protein [Methylomarinovum sp. IN45]BCX89948.1 hypothetical protein MIN45_P2322 [Methylomarinovum sp. IN45]
METSEQLPERRRFFRVEDEIVLVYRPIAPEDMPPVEAFQNQLVDHFSLTSTLAYLTQESQAQLHRIERENPAVADYLKTLERKIEALAQAVMISNNRLADQPTRKVNLSAAGIAFTADQPLAEGGLLELKMVLPPSLVGIVTFGKVVYCTPLEEGEGWRVGVDFLSMREQDREVLIRHVVKRQLTLIRARKHPPAS